ncbi:MAG TPA: hypothetical protein VFT45_15680, partial [Longimicrobium sp.]|nr:hypothetical protein [Longimicrobium sp.]
MDGMDAMLMQAMEELEVVAKRKRDLEGFILICSEYRRAGRPNALAQVVVPPGMSPAAPLVEGDRASIAEHPRRPGVDLADPDLSLVDAAAKV